MSTRVSKNANMSSTKPVIIIGGGPIGLALSVDLALRGIHSVLIERRAPVISVPKMNMVNARSMEFSRRWGLVDQVHKLGCPPDLPQNVMFCTALCGHEIARFEYPSYNERGELPYSPEGSWRISQMHYDPLLIAKAQDMPEIELCHETQCLEFHDKGTSVTVKIRDLKTGAEKTIEGAYLVACDGAESGTRETLGIEMQGAGQLSRQVNLFFTTPNLTSEHDKGYAWANWLLGETGHWGLIVSVDGRTMWRMSTQLPAEVDAINEDEACALIEKAVGKPFEFELRAILPWLRRQLVAEHYGKGRVFLAGDAAHVMSPTGGLGMNTGLGDAIDLSWKLAAVMHGWGGEKLLESYQAERRQIALRNVEEAGENFKKIRAIPGDPAIKENSPEGAKFRERLRAFIQTDAYEEEYRQEGTVFGYQYTQSPVLKPAPNGPLDKSYSGDYVQSDAVGGRAPHLWLAPGISTIDKYWNAMTLVCIGAANAPQATKAAKDRSIPFQIVQLNDEQAAGLYQSAFTLVRPDGHVAWTGNEIESDWGEILGFAVGQSG